METKVCAMCKEDIPLTTEFFSFGKPGGKNKTPSSEKKYPMSYCKVCCQVRNFKIYYKNKEKKQEEARIRARERALRSDAVYKRYVGKLKCSYSLTEEGFRSLMDKQKGCCAICGSSLVNPSYNPNDLHIDHDHTTGKVRGLLCSNCNTGLGQFRDEPRLLTEAMLYLIVNKE